VANLETIGFKALALHHHAGTNQRRWEQGALIATERQLDLAIDGEGFFRVQLPGGQIAFTRGCNFGVDAQGNLISAEGHLTEPQFTIPENSIGVTVDATGRIFVTDPANPGTPTEIGQLTLTRFINPSGLEAFGDTLYLQSAKSGQPIDGQAGDRAQGFGIVRQGFIEKSNVGAMRETVALLEDSRAAETIITLLGRLR
jgi:flagellar basal-body rod protein FlgG